MSFSPIFPPTKKLAQAALGSSDGAVFTVPSGKTWIISGIHLASVSIASVTFRLNHVASGGSSADSNALFKNAILTAGQTLVFGTGFIFETGEMLRGLCSTANGVTVTVYGREI
jgi:hypothetical protein